ncbi:MAG: hypothetical protein A2Z17_06605 [Gammaproteobacteria bacterium RBG_16_66_13]|nr:MAG: hypothetical protein A2Z17_06605 [Gammaproteobacteria bacterium RBG_16_66_13]
MPTYRRLLALVSLGLTLGLAACASATAPTPTPAAATPTSPSVDTQASSSSTATAEESPIATFVLDQGETQARFLIDEILRGSPNTVVGATSQVTAEITIDLGSPDRSLLGPIWVEAGSLATDSSLRDRAIRNFILQTSAFPQIVFTPTSLEGLPTAASVGGTFTFSITGDLTVRDVTHPVTFEVTLTAETGDRLNGLATTTILRSDYGLTIPSVPSVADVSQEVGLELEFTAVRAP